MTSKRPLQKLRLPLTLLVLAGAVVLLSCSKGGKNAAGFAERRLTLERADGQTIRMRVELAQTNAQRAQGLMNRPVLPDGRGMLFIFDQDEYLSFWMKDTVIPLSIAFIASGGRILEIYDMYPLDLSPVSSHLPARYALEVPQGWFSRTGIQAGDRMLPSSLP